MAVCKRALFQSESNSNKMMGTGMVTIILLSFLSTCSSTNEFYEMCIKNFGKQIDQDLCLPKNYRWFFLSKEKNEFFIS